MCPVPAAHARPTAPRPASAAVRRARSSHLAQLRQRVEVEPLAARDVLVVLRRGALRGRREDALEDDRARASGDRPTTVVVGVLPSQ